VNATGIGSTQAHRARRGDRVELVRAHTMKEDFFQNVAEGSKSVFHRHCSE